MDGWTARCLAEAGACQPAAQIDPLSTMGRRLTSPSELAPPTQLSTSGGYSNMYQSDILADYSVGVLPGVMVGANVADGPDVGVALGVAVSDRVFVDDNNNNSRMVISSGCIATSEVS